MLFLGSDVYCTTVKFLYFSVSNMRRCLVCDERLVHRHHSLKQCDFCGMYYANHAKKCIPEVYNTITGKEYFLTNYPRKNNVQNKCNTVVLYKKSCHYMDPKGRCTNNDAKYTGQHCKSSKCEYYIT